MSGACGDPVADSPRVLGTIPPIESCRKQRVVVAVDIVAVPRCVDAH